MPLNECNSTSFYLGLYAGQLQTIILRKRDDDQREGVVREVKVFNCRREPISESGQPINGDMTSNHHCFWNLPVIELKRRGVQYINPGDEIRDLKRNETWRFESTGRLDINNFGTMVRVHCTRIL